MTGGMVAQQQHLVLPSISPMATALITVVAMLVCIDAQLTKNAIKGLLDAFEICEEMMEYILY